MSKLPQVKPTRLVNFFLSGTLQSILKQAFMNREGFLALYKK